MPEITIDTSYQKLIDLILLIDSPYQEICLQIYQDNRELFEHTHGSTHNHQTWEGGYIDHITDGMNYIRCTYLLEESFGRPMKFSMSDALLIFFLHDLEKPWRLQLTDTGVINRPGLDTKEAFKAFRENKLANYGLELTDYQQNGLTYVEGELSDYSSTHRVMNELAAFCHKADVWSARQCYDYPKMNDEWVGAGRFRTEKNIHHQLIVEHANMRKRLLALEPLLYEVARRADKMHADDGEGFTVTIDPEMWSEIKDEI